MTEHGKPAAWVVDAVKPGEDEVAAAERALPEEVAAWAAEATAPGDAETVRVLARLNTSSSSPRPRALVWVPVAIAAVAGIWIGIRETPTPTEEATATSETVTVVVTDLPDPVPAHTPKPALEVPETPPPVVAVVGAPTRLSGDEAVQAGPSVTLTGAAEITLVALTDAGPSVELTRGELDVSVDPAGAQRALSVTAGDVTVRVLGTVFRMERQDDALDVSVTRGVVEVEHRGDVVRLTAGERWSRPRPVALGTPPAPAPDEAEPDPEPDEAEPAPDPDPEPVPEVPEPFEAFNAILDLEDQGATPATLVAKLDEFLKLYPDSVFAPEARDMRDKARPAP